MAHMIHPVFLYQAVSEVVKKQKRTRVPSIDVSDQVESAVLRTYGMVWRRCGGRYGVAEIAMMTMNGCFLDWQIEADHSRGLQSSVSALT